MEKAKIGDLEVWWVPQVPMEAFRVSVKSIAEAKLILRTLGRYDAFQFENNIKPDYCNAGGLEVFEEGEDGPEWCEWYSDEGDNIDDYAIEGGGV